MKKILIVLLFPLTVSAQILQNDSPTGRDIMKAWSMQSDIQKQIADLGSIGCSAGDLMINIISKRSALVTTVENAVIIQNFNCKPRPPELTYLRSIMGNVTIRENSDNQAPVEIGAFTLIDFNETR